MKIEDEIQSSKFHNERHKATINVVFTSNWITDILENRAVKHKITLQQYNILRILRGQYPSPATNCLLKERMLDKTPDVSRIVDRLVSKGLVSKKTSSIDRRAVDVLITQKGLDTLTDLDERMLMMDVLEGNITEAECRILNNLLDKLRGHVSTGVNN
ncbi:MarR family winged helix-turn-helix transcriptional regulator [Parapedobacter sp.]